MGGSHVTDYARGLQFVQSLNDDNFGEIDVYRNQDGKFIMKCSKSFITGDKRHSDFMRALQFSKETKNINLIPVLYMQQYQQSNVCISYQKIQVYSEYLNFTLEGLIKNKKSVQQSQIWYLIKTMLLLIKDLQSYNMKMIFTLSNIFLTLKGIPSINLYHFLVQQSLESGFGQENKQDRQLNKQRNYSQQNIQDDLTVHQNQEEQTLSHQQHKQITLKPYCMHFCLAKIILQLFNMSIIQTSESSNQIQEIKDLLFSTITQNKNLGKFIKLLLSNSNTQNLLLEIKYLQETNQIKLSTQIRFNKFRYILTEEQKPQQNLTLNDNIVNNFKSKPITPINTPIYRLREQDNTEFLSKQLGLKSKLLMSEKHFFRKKGNQSIKNFQSNQEQQTLTSDKVLGRTKAYSIGGKQNVSILGQSSKNRKSTVERGSKLSLVGNRNLSRSKLNDNNKNIISHEYSSVNGDYNQLGLTLSRQFYSHQFATQTKNQQQQSLLNQDKYHSKQQHNKLNQQYMSVSNIQTLKQKQSKQLKSTNRIKQILNQQLIKNNPSIKDKNYTLLNNNILHTQQSYQLTNYPQKVKSFFKEQQHKNSQQKFNSIKSIKQQKSQLINKYQHQHQHILYKPYHTEIQPQNQHLQSQPNHQQISKIFNQSNQKTSNMKESINALDKSNFLSALELKKSTNHLKVKQLTQRKDSIMFDLQSKKHSKGGNNNNQTNQNIKQYLKQKIQTKSNKNNSKSPLNQIKSNSNISSDRITQNGIEKKKIKLKNNDKILQKDPNKQNKINKQNQINITEQIMRNSQLKRVSIRAKGQPTTIK